MIDCRNFNDKPDFSTTCHIDRRKCSQTISSVNEIAILVSKMTSHCAGTVQMREESESGIRKWEEMWFKTTAEDAWREGAVVTDVRWKTVPQTSGCDRKRSFADSGQTSTSKVQRRWWGRTYIVVVWIPCLPVDVVRHTAIGNRLLWRQAMLTLFCTPKQRILPRWYWSGTDPISLLIFLLLLRRPRTTSKYL